MLDNLCTSLREDAESIHEDFRLILTSMPVDYFPSSILQNGVKMTTEPNKGLKANMKRIFSNLIDEGLFNSAEESIKEGEMLKSKQDLLLKTHWSMNLSQDSGSKVSTGGGRKPHHVRPSLLSDFERQFDLPKCWKSLLFGLGFFHSVIKDRKKFGSIGWNIKYEFNDSDLETSIKML
jgi:dynein heavy chain